MSELTLESLAKRIAALESALATMHPKQSWRQAVGMFAGSEIMQRVDEEGRRIREAEREAARQGVDGEGGMILLDTDHVTCLKYPEHPRAQHLVAKLDALPESEVVAVSIITIEEQMRGWLAVIAKERQSRRQVLAYRELQRLFEYFQAFQIIPFDDPCADQFEMLRVAKLRIGTMDLKIAATALLHKAVLLSANTRDFERVPALVVENWLE